MKFGIVGANTGAYATRDGARTVATAAEGAGFESLWTFEHVVAPVGYESTYPYASSGKAPMLDTANLPDPITWLSFVSAVTDTIRLGTGILILPQRNPVVLAKEVASLDVLSGGRVELGIGVGWLEEEFDALGVPFARRGARTDEYMRILRALWAGDDASFDGDFVSFAPVNSRPRPLGNSVPLHVGGHSEAAARRAGRLGDGFFPALDAASIEEHGLDGALKRLLDLTDLARRTAEDHDRDPDALEVSFNTGVAPPPAIIADLGDKGVDRLVFLMPTRRPDEVDDKLGALAEQLGLG